MDGRVLLGATAAIGLAGLAAWSRRGSECPECGGPLHPPGSAVREKDPDSAISEALFERRYTEPSLFLLDAEYVATYVCPRWEALKETRGWLVSHPDRLSADALQYGGVKVIVAQRRADKKGTDLKKDQIGYAADWQTKQELAREFSPPEDKLLIPCGPDPYTLETRLRPKSQDLRIVLEPTNASGEPRLAISNIRTGQRQVLFGLDKARSLFWPCGLDSANLFSATSKMAAPSFSLPAGRAGEGGTCAAEGFGADNADPIKSNICTLCYALKGHYGYLSNVVPGLVRKAWVRQELELDPSGRRLGELLTEAICAFAVTGAGSKGWKDRSELELGTWRKGKLYGPKRAGGRGRRLVQEPIPPTWLDPETAAAVGVKPGTTTDDLRRQDKVPNGAIAGFFRIHDSGDFSIPTGQQGYIAAWSHVAQRLPHVRFWAPTRIWVIGLDPTRTTLSHPPTWNENMLARAAAAAPGNLAIRPSAITVDDPTPTIPGLAAGTGVNEPHKDSYVQLTDANGATAYQCPVYSRVLEDPKSPGKKKEATSCAEAGCRVCWVAKDVPVAYGKH